MQVKILTSVSQIKFTQNIKTEDDIGNVNLQNEDSDDNIEKVGDNENDNGTLRRRIRMFRHRVFKQLKRKFKHKSWNRILHFIKRRRYWKKKLPYFSRRNFRRLKYKIPKRKWKRLFHSLKNRRIWKKL